MSGICGSVGIVGAVSDPVARALASLATRGPDGGRRVEGRLGTHPVTFGVRRLALREPGRNTQPAVVAGSMLVFDGEIENVDDLARSLADRGIEVPPASEAAVLGALIQHDGIEALARVKGTYSFAYLGGTRGPLLLGRDPSGARPLVYAVRRDGIAFASTIDALLAMGVGRPRPDTEVIGALLRDGVAPGRRTAAMGIERVLAGEVLSIDDSFETLSVDIPETELQFENEPHDVLEVLRGAVFERLMTDRRVGILLSGGADSAIIAALAREAGDVPAWSLTFPGHRTADETARVRRTARKLGLRHRLTPCPPDPTPWVLGASRAFDEPCGDPAAVPMWGLARAAGQSVRSALTGLGGDDVFGGHRRYWLMGAGPWLRHVPTFVHAPVNSVLGRADRAGMRRARRPIGPPGAWRGVLRLHPPRFVRTVLGPLLEDASRPLARPGGSVAVASAERGVMEVDLARHDRAFGAHGVEGRHPFLDVRVRAAVAGVEVTGREGRSKQKQVLRAFVQDVVDPDLARIGQQGLAFPVDDLYRGPLRPLAQDALLGKPARERGFISPAGARRVLRDHVSNARNHGLLIHSLVMLELWSRRVLDGN